MTTFYEYDEDKQLVGVRVQEDSMPVASPVAVDPPTHDLPMYMPAQYPPHPYMMHGNEQFASTPPTNMMIEHHSSHMTQGGYEALTPSPRMNFGETFNGQMTDNGLWNNENYTDGDYNDMFYADHINEYEQIAAQKAEQQSAQLSDENAVGNVRSSQDGDSQTPFYESHLDASPTPGPAPAEFPSQYPDPEAIRQHHNLISFISHVNPDRLSNARYGKKVDIVEEHTDLIFANEVPKKLLVLFCGRHFVSKHIRTVEPGENGKDVKQILQLPVHRVNHIGIKIMLSWMMSACNPQNMGKVTKLHCPKRLFCAISLARTLDMFGFHWDASHIDYLISTHLFNRPLFSDQIKPIWSCLPKNSKYTYRMVKSLRAALVLLEQGDKTALGDPDAVKELLHEIPNLKARIEDPELDNAFKPFFGSDWCERAAENTKRMIDADINSTEQDVKAHQPASHHSNWKDKKLQKKEGKKPVRNGAYNTRTAPKNRPKKGNKKGSKNNSNGSSKNSLKTSLKEDPKTTSLKEMPENLAAADWPTLPEGTAVIITPTAPKLSFPMSSKKDQN